MFDFYKEILKQSYDANRLQKLHFNCVLISKHKLPYKWDINVVIRIEKFGQIRPK
jgi:hypothetical protein